VLDAELTPSDWRRAGEQNLSVTVTTMVKENEKVKRSGLRQAVASGAEKGQCAAARRLWRAARRAGAGAARAGRASGRGERRGGTEEQLAEKSPSDQKSHTRDGGKYASVCDGGRWPLIGPCAPPARRELTGLQRRPRSLWKKDDKTFFHLCRKTRPS
jgi:hypothetical protein